MQATKEKIYPALFPVWKKCGVNDLQKRCRVYFIGIGGIGVSALAQYFLVKRNKVFGSDLVCSETIKNLKKLGAKIFIGKHKESNLPKGVSRVIYSPAVKTDNPELKKARKLKILCQSYPQALGELTKKYFTIAVSGTHGKSTTSAMIGLILIKAGLDPTVIIGTKLKEFKNSNFRLGKSKYLVIEADEWQASFLNYWPQIIVLTNIEEEHLDYYRDLGHILKIYKEYINQLPEDGFLVANGEDRNVLRLLNSTRPNFAKRKLRRARIQNSNIKKFSIKQKEAERIKKILKIPGEHNVANALAALAVARVLGIDDRKSFEALAEYKGSWRRFDVTRKGLVTSKGKISFTLINDYAHHPTEIKSTLKAIREKYVKEKIWCIFQPHQYQRTFYLFKDFVRVFREALGKKFAWEPACQSLSRQAIAGRGSHCRSPKGRGAIFACDKLIITDIYDVAGREKRGTKKKINSQKLVKAICGGLASAAAEARPPQASYLPKQRIIPYLKKNLKGGEIIILMGAGDIYNLNFKFKL